MSDIKLAVNGTLMRGLELNKNLLEVGATFIKEATTETAYRLFSIGDIAGQKRCCDRRRSLGCSPPLA